MNKKEIISHMKKWQEKEDWMYTEGIYFWEAFWHELEYCLEELEKCDEPKEEYIWNCNQCWELIPKWDYCKCLHEKDNDLEELWKYIKHLEAVKHVDVKWWALYDVCRLLHKILSK